MDEGPGLWRRQWSPCDGIKARVRRQEQERGPQVESGDGGPRCSALGLKSYLLGDRATEHSSVHTGGGGCRRVAPLPPPLLDVADA